MTTRRFSDEFPYPPAPKPTMPEPIKLRHLDPATADHTALVAEEREHNAQVRAFNEWGIKYRAAVVAESLDAIKDTMTATKEVVASADQRILARLKVLENFCFVLGNHYLEGVKGELTKNPFSELTSMLGIKL